MFISQLYRLGQIQKYVTLWSICANIIENESLVTSTDKKNQSDNGHICKNPPVQLNYTELFILEIEIIAKIINEIFFSLLLIIAIHRGSCFFYASIPEIKHASC